MEILNESPNGANQNQNLAFIGLVFESLIKLSTSSKPIRINDWLPAITDFKTTMEQATIELNRYDSYETPHFKNLKERVKNQLANKQEIIDELLMQKMDLETDELEHEFDKIEDQLDKATLSSKQILVLSKVMISRYFQRLQTDDYAEFDDLSSIVSSSEKPKVKAKNDLSGKQIAWIIEIRKEMSGTTRLTMQQLSLKYRIKESSLISRFKEIDEAYSCIKRNSKPNLNRKRIINDLNVVHDYFKMQNEVENQRKVKEIIERLKNKIYDDDNI